MSSDYDSVILLTGGSSGIGLCCAKELSKAYPRTLVIVGSRSAPPGPLPSNIKHNELDLESPSSVRAFVSSWSYPPISSLLLNSGIWPWGPPKYTSDGTELGFAVNHVNHALLFFLLKNKDLLAPDCRIIITTSALHDPKSPGAPHHPHWAGPQAVAESRSKELEDSGTRYANAKLANILFAYALDSRIKRSGKGWTVIAFEPGFTPGSNLGKCKSSLVKSITESLSTRSLSAAPLTVRLVAKVVLPLALPIFRMMGTVTSTPQKSGETLAQFAISQKFRGVSGKYFLLYNERRSSDDSYKTELQDALWDWTVDKVANDDHEKLTFNTI